MNYYDMKKRVYLDLKQWIVNYSEAVDNDKPTPEWKEFCNGTMERYGADETFCNNILKKNFGLKINNNKLEKNETL